jgi:type IV pilus assembly protein PilB
MDMSNDVIIGELLVRAGLIDSSALAQAREVQQKDGISLAKALETLRLADGGAVSAAIAESLHLELLCGDLPEILPEVVALLPGDFCRKRLVVPLSVQGNSLRLALANPMDYSTTQDVEFRAGKPVVAVVAAESSIQSLLDKFYPLDLTAEALKAATLHGEVEELEDSEFEVVDPAKLAKDTKTPPVIRLVNLILSGAAQGGASDIHMEPKETYLQVRYRVDGLLHDVIRVGKDQQEAAISRMKIISGMDIADRRRPQDGRSRLRYEGKRIDLRVSTLPTQFGEKVVIRLLDSKRAQITMQQLGLTPENQHNFESMLSRAQGMILVTGPTGCGKTSTLYTALNWVKSPTKNIITVEDPIEYQLEGVNQVQINPKAGVTFAAGLRSILRQDPNIILVGEIRDRETAAIALEAAQTGHLLLSTVHTNNAPSTISRLLDLGIEPYLISSAVIGILAQRLVRKTCPSCAISQPPSAELIEKIGGRNQLPADGHWVVGRGCKACGDTGYAGRLAIHELLLVTDAVRDLISRRAQDHEIRRAARTAGMRTLLEDGVAKAARGLTTLDEVLRVAVIEGTDASPEGDALRNTEVAAAASTSRANTGQDASDAGTISDTQGSVDGNRACKPRVLVVEDDGTTSQVVKYFLELEGFEVLIAKDGASGLETLRRERPQLVVTDCNMPGMNGMSMVKALRADPLTRDIAVLMLTSEEGVDKETEALAVGVDDYIVKPVEPRRLAARVKSVLMRSKERREAVSR